MSALSILRAFWAVAVLAVIFAFGYFRARRRQRRITQGEHRSPRLARRMDGRNVEQ
jgi:hypothetical protein